MPLNSKLPNSQFDINQYSNAVENSIRSLSSSPGRLLKARMTLLGEMTNKIDKPILKQFAKDMLGVLSSWLDDPQILCCLIQGIWAAYNSKNAINNQIPRNSIVLAETDFGKWLDYLIAFLDLVIVLLTQDIKRLALFIPDIIKELFTSIMGAVLLVVQETLFALRDSVLKVVFDWMDEWDTEQTWSKCLPLKAMIDILKKYVHDYGLLADLFEKIKAFVSGSKKTWAANSSIVANAKDLEFLYWLRDLLVNLKRAVINFDFCVDYEFVPTASNIDTPGVAQSDRVLPTGLDAFRNPATDNIGDPASQQGYTIGADGTIIVDKDKMANTGNYISRVSNSFLREFIHNQYNIPYDVIDNTITRGSSTDHIQGTVVTSVSPENIVSRCANTPTAQETLSWILNLKDRTT